ncbi:MAG: hypothetical protein ACD_47C00591G0001, partial [uncultured bacterium]
MAVLYAEPLAYDLDAVAGVEAAVTHINI